MGQTSWVWLANDSFPHPEVWGVARNGPALMATRIDFIQQIAVAFSTVIVLWLALDLIIRRKA